MLMHPASILNARLEDVLQLRDCDNMGPLTSNYTVLLYMKMTQINNHC